MSREPWADEAAAAQSEDRRDVMLELSGELVVVAREVEHKSRLGLTQWLTTFHLFIGDQDRPLGRIGRFPGTG